MKKFFVRFLYFLIPVILLFATYFIFDPFKVLYGIRFSELDKEKFNVELNNNYFATRLYLHNKQTIHYNSFLFGSSRGLAFRVADWKQYLPKDAVGFNFCVPRENLFGIWKKLKFIEEQHDSLKNVVMIICPDYTLKTVRNNPDHISILDPVVSKESALRFQSKFFLAYFSKGFFIRYIDYMIFGKIRPYMNGYLHESLADINLDVVANDLKVYYPELMIAKDSAAYYQYRMKEFFSRDTLAGMFYDQQITPGTLEILKEIKSIFDRHHTSYKLAISPLYNQMIMNRSDFQDLCNIFGEENVYDFSGVNDFTSDISNYYEPAHYRIKVGQRIFSELYQEPSSQLP